MIINGRSIDATEYLGENALINQKSKNVFISSDGKIAGIQISTDTDQIKLNSDLPFTVRTNYHNNKFIILMYGASGQTIEGDNILLFSSNEDYTIESVIVANILGEEMNVEINNSLAPNTFRLDQNYPNPFNPKTHIQFNLAHDELLNLQVYDVSGRLVNSLISNSLYSAGYHTILWNGTNNKGANVPSGVYFYKLIGENQTLTKKMLLIK